MSSNDTIPQSCPGNLAADFGKPEDAPPAMEATAEELLRAKSKQLDDLSAAFRETQQALFQTQTVLKERTETTDAELAHLRVAFRQTQDALFHTQKVLRDQQVTFGLIDPISEEAIAPDRSLPSILLVCPPKSAGAYVMHTLMHGLKLERRWISTGTFAPDLLRQAGLESFRRLGGSIAFHHLDASEVNLFYLQQTDLKPLFHIRDPRQCLLSMIHYSLRHFPRGQQLVHLYEPPDDFESYPVEKKIDWAIDTHLARYVRWIQEWLAAVDSGKINALTTDYNEMVRDESAFFRKVLGFYGIPEDRFQHPSLRLDDRVNFRSGDPDEWRQVFSENQKERAAAMIPADLKARYGWPD